LKLLLDQGFPNPVGFDVGSVDSSLDVIHLSAYDRSLSENSTPDWMLYWIAHHDGFDAFVTRDLAQRTQLVEMYVLSRLGGFSIISWTRAIEDPVTEWGQLIAYLPEIRKKFENDASRGKSGNVILLPRPTLTAHNLMNANDLFGELAKESGTSNAEARRDVKNELLEVLASIGRNPADFADLVPTP
jgi:hypothetical protein